MRGDFIDPRGGRDRVLAGGGADRIKAFDGLVDRISCGPGADVVAADLGDRVANDCETVSRRLTVDRISDPEFRHATHVEPDTFAFGSTLVSVYQVGRAPAPGGSAAANGYSTTRDGGRTWRSGVLPRLTRNSRPAGEWARASDPVIAYSARHGVWLASSLVTSPGARSGLTFNRSPDGVTWSDPIVATSVTGRDLAVDKQWATCDNWPQSPNYGRCYLAYTDVLRGSRISLQTSSDGGLTWSSPIGSPDNAGRNNEQVARRAAGRASRRGARDRVPRRRPHRRDSIHRRRADVLADAVRRPRTGAAEGSTSERSRSPWQRSTPRGRSTLVLVRLSAPSELQTERICSSRDRPTACSGLGRPASARAAPARTCTTSCPGLGADPRAPGTGCGRLVPAPAERRHRCVLRALRDRRNALERRAAAEHGDDDAQLDRADVARADARRLHLDLVRERHARGGARARVPPRQAAGRGDLRGPPTVTTLTRKSETTASPAADAERSPRRVPSGR